MESRGADYRKFADIVSRSTDYLRTVSSHARIEDAEVPKVAKSATVESIRAEIAKVKANIRSTLAAPLPSSMAKAKAKAQIEALAEQGAPDIFRLIERGEEIRWPALATSINTANLFAPLGDGMVTSIRGPLGVKTPDAPALMAWLFRDQMLARIEQEIDAESDDTHALTPDAREAKVTELDAELLRLERIDAFLTEQAGAEHRADCDCRALLAVEIAE